MTIFVTFYKKKTGNFKGKIKKIIKKLVFSLIFDQKKEQIEDDDQADRTITKKPKVGPKIKE